MKFNDFCQFIRPEVQGCPDFLIERAVRDASIDFCKRTDMYMPEPELVTIIKGVNEYSLSLPSGTELNHIIDIYDNKRRLKPVAYTELLQRQGDEDEQGTPQYYAQRDNLEFYLAPFPNKADSYRVLYSVKPTSSAQSIPDTIGKEHRETLCHGALYRLQMQSGQSWFNPAAAGDNKSLFEREVGRAVRTTKYGFSGGSLTCKPRAFI